MHQKAILGSAVALVVILVGGALVMSKQTNDQAEVVTATSEPNPQASASAAPAADVVTVTLSDSGFNPASITVKAGQTVAFTTSIEARISSDPHPVHTDDEELNLPATQPGETVRITPTRKGTFGVHNHLKPSQKMTIVVQ